MRIVHVVHLHIGEFILVRRVFRNRDNLVKVRKGAEAWAKYPNLIIVLILAQIDRGYKFARGWLLVQALITGAFS